MILQKTHQVNITYETLFDILRVEKGRDDIQELSRTYYSDVIAYMQQKKELIAKMEHESGIDSFDEVKKLQIQFDNIQRIVKEIFQRREKKILLMALNGSRTKKSMAHSVMHSEVHTEALLNEEKIFFERLKFVLVDNRNNTLHTVLGGKLPGYGKMQSASMPVVKEIATKEQASSVLLEESTEKQEDVSGMFLLRFITDVEQFIGPELETYGPFDSGATAYVPEMIAQILIDASKAEKA